MTVFFMINTFVLAVLVMYLFVYYHMNINLKKLATFVDEVTSPKSKQSSPDASPRFKRQSKSLTRAHSSSEVVEEEAEIQK